MTPIDRDAGPKILILEDDRATLEKHRKALEKRGVSCFPTRLASEAIKIMREHKSIRFALIDEILHEVKDHNDSSRGLGVRNKCFIHEPEMQPNTGCGVVRIINQHREDVSYIFVTSAPDIVSHRSNNQMSAFKKEEARLLRNRGVKEVIHRYLLDDSDLDRNREIYDRIFRQVEAAYASPFVPMNKRIAIACCSQSVGHIQVIPHLHPQMPSTDLHKYGTGWLISPDIVLTNWHLFDGFDNIEEIQNRGKLDLPMTVSSSQIKFDYLEPGTGIAYRFSEIIYQNPTIDYALLRLHDRADYPLSQRAPLRLESQNPVQGNPGLVIIHHPGRVEQQTSLGWYVKLSDDSARILYTVPTAGGTSGAPVIRADNAKVIALHTAFNCDYSLQEGLLIAKVLEDLRDRDRSLYNEITHYQLQR